jgi:cobaltochelatase CobT
LNEQVRKRQIERHCAATIRALSGHPGAEYRRELLFEDGRGVDLYSPHLAADVVNHSLERCRGIADAMALRLVHTDFELHRSLQPKDEIGRMVFDILEQMRAESLAPRDMKGLQHNLDRAFHEWCRESRRSGLTENELGLLIYSVIQVVRARLISEQQEEEVECLIESTRFKLAPLIGDQLAQLRAKRFDQQAYAELALTIANAVSEMARAAAGDDLDHEVSKARHRLLMPRQHESDDRYVEGGAAGAGQTLGAGDEGDPYPVFCRDYDREVEGRSLYRLAQRTRLRQQLDKLVAAQAVSAPRLAQRLKNLFAVFERSGWNFGEEEGYLDGRRLSQLAANSSYTRVFKQQRYSPWCDTVVTFLLDNSGSMKRQRFEAVAVMVDIYSRALELAGIRSEILGFTTGGWTGGESIKAWRAAGMPSYPGRLNDRMHIVYKDADTSWRRARYGIASLLNTNHFREGLDGEALEWAAQRLRLMNASRKCLVVISDGAPMDSATAHYNDEYFLERHLRQVVRKLERDPSIELTAIGIALDMGEFFSRSVALDLTGTLGNRVFRALEDLYGARQH